MTDQQVTEALRLARRIKHAAAAAVPLDEIAHLAGLLVSVLDPTPGDGATSMTDEDRGVTFAPTEEGKP